MSVTIKIKGKVHADEVKHRRANRKLREQNDTLFDEIKAIKKDMRTMKSNMTKLKNAQKKE